jgi:hypothetical protein
MDIRIHHPTVIRTVTPDVSGEASDLVSDGVPAHAVTDGPDAC